MPNNPVQFVANGDDFIQDRDPGRKGEEKDFFEDRDADFRAHQDQLVQALQAIDAAITRAGHGPATYVRVTLREAALAKSYRPNGALLTPDRFPCVGAGAIGEIFFFLPQVQLPELIARIRKAEATVPVTTSRTGRVYRTTTRLRSEVGAIETIEILPAVEKRLFSAADAVQSFLDPHTFPGYQVELFEVPPQRAIETDRWGRRQLFESLFNLLLSLGDGARSFLLPDVGRTPMLEVQLTRSDDTPLLLDLRQRVTTSTAVVTTTPGVDASVDRHEAALNLLAAHPLVRRIDPPVQLTLDQKDRPNKSSTAAKAFQLPTPVPEATYLLSPTSSNFCHSPRFSGFEDGVEGYEQLAHDGGGDDLEGLAAFGELASESLDDGVALQGDYGCHVERAADGAPSGDDVTRRLRLAAVPVDRRQARQSRCLAFRQVPEFRHVGEQGCHRHRTDTFQAAHQSGLARHRLARLDQRGDLGLQRIAQLLQADDVRFQRPGDARMTRMFEPVALGDQHVEDFGTAVLQVLERPCFRARRLIEPQTVGPEAVERDDAGVDRIGLGQHAEIVGEVAYALAVRQVAANAEFDADLQHGTLIAAGGFADHEQWPELLPFIATRLGHQQLADGLQLVAD